jgi:hypothetical protein
MNNHFRVSLCCVRGRCLQRPDPQGIGFFLIRESSCFPIVGYPEARQPLWMAGPRTIPESGAPYDALHSMKKRAISARPGGARPKATRTSFRMPRLLRVLRWLEKFSPPRVLVTFVPDSQRETPTTFSETKGSGKIEVAKARTITGMRKVEAPESGNVQDTGATVHE